MVAGEITMGAKSSVSGNQTRAPLVVVGEQFLSALIRRVVELTLFFLFPVPNNITT